MKRQRIFLFLLSIQSLTVLYAQDIFDAARNGNIKRIEELIKINPDTVNAYNSAGFTPLIIAGYRNQIHVVEFLLKHNANVNADSPEGPAILSVCYKGNTELAELLIDYKANVNVQNDAGTSALMYAVLSDNTFLVSVLLKNGAKKDLEEKSGRTAMDYAKTSESEMMIRLLE